MMLGSNFTDATLYVPEGTVEKYKATGGWKNFNKILVIGTGINALSVNESVDSYYTLDGRKVQGQPAEKGVYIVNGRKVVIK